MTYLPKLLPVRVYGDEMLRRKADEIESITDEIREFIQDLVHTMYLRDGVGLAAPQAGKSIRVFVMDPLWSREGNEKNPVALINPVIESYAGESENEEGCISIPGIFANVCRPSRIGYSYTDIDGKQHCESAEGFDAIVFQHEFDHLEGVLFTDRISSLAKLKLKRRLKELEKGTVNGENIRTDIFIADEDE
ncbi:MAG: peptide deformylase [Candidatus Cloacimonadaceae bacterium]|nr:peptide deformylase [Candidatus Cloacimonadaceae bacterium]